MREFIREAKGLGFATGLTIDPLLVDGGDKAWTAETDDGYRWLNVGHPKGRAYGIERIAKAAKWGPRFFVVTPSRIPNGVLSHFGITREEATTYALEVAMEGAEGLAVVPAATLTLSQTPSKWHDASTATSWYGHYGMIMGPLRLDTSRIQSVSTEFAKVLRQYDGPVELVGKPPRGVAKDLGAALTAK